MISTSAGMRCAECAFINPQVPKAVVQPGSMGMASFAALLTGLAGAYILALLAFVNPLLSILVAPLYGRLVADAVKSFSGDCKTPTPEAVGVGSILLSSLIAFGLPFGSMRFAHNSMTDLAQAMIGIAIGLSVAICYHHLKQRPS